MIEWTLLPRGTWRYSEDGRTADVWRVGGGFRFTVIDNASGVYLASGEYVTEDGATEAALDALWANGGNV